MNDYSLIKDSISTCSDSSNSLITTLVVLISLNLGIEIFKFVATLIASNREKNNKRQLLIEEKRIKVLEQLFKALDSLTLFDKSDETLLLDKLKEISQFITQNKIYIPKVFQKNSNEIMDYFKSVLVDFRHKSVEKESQLFDNFCNEFNK